MALPAGSENPSAAYLAGQAHGAQLAVKHHFVKTTKPTTTRPAAPTKRTPTTTTTAPPTNTLLDQAKALAAADTQAQVDAIRAAQDQYTKQASDRASQVNLAAQAAAKYLTGIGDATATSYQDAAKTLAGFASGYSGDLRATAEGAAAQQQAALAGLGAPAEGLKTPTGPVGSPTSLANVLYGLGGVIPSTLLVTAGQAQAGAQRQLPAATLGYGQQEALGVLGAGAKQADTLTPDLLAAQGKLPALTQQYLAALQNREHQLFGEKLDLAKYRTGIDQWTAEQKLALAKYGTSIDQFNTRTKLQVQQFNARQTLATTRLQWQQANADRNYGLSYAKFMQAERNAAARTKRGGLTENEWNTLTAKVQDYTNDLFHGVPGHVTYPNASNGLTAPRIDSWKQKPLTYKQAIKTLIQRYPSIGASGAIAAANLLYPPGEGGRPKTATDLTAPAVQGPGLGDQSSYLVREASSVVGTPYSWGGGNTSGPTLGTGRGANTKGFDCSSFLQYALAKVGVHIPRTTYLQAKYGKAVTLQNLKAGDAIFTRPGKLGPNHVGLYIGNGMVQESPHTGDVNKIIPLNDFLTGGFVAARRYLPAESDFDARSSGGGGNF